MLRKTLVRFDRVRRDADDFRAGRGIIIPTVAHRTHLPRANRRFVSGIEEQDDDLAAMIRQTPLRSFAVAQNKVRGCHARSGCVCVCRAHFMKAARLVAATCVRISTSLPRVVIFRLSRAVCASSFVGGCMRAIRIPPSCFKPMTVPLRFLADSALSERATRNKDTSASVVPTDP